MDYDRGLLADIGATNARFALADAKGVHAEKILKCADYPGLAEAAQAYMAEAGVLGTVTAAAVAIAGPVTGDQVTMTNHPWQFSIAATKRSLGLNIFHVINDFKAQALAIPHLRAQDLRQVGGGVAVAQAPIGVIGPGTGLGVASLVWGGQHYIPVPGEGGHVTMPARTPREFAVFQTLLQGKYHHVSAERVCSGKGLLNIYESLRALEGHTDLPARTPEEISRAAQEGRCAVCGEALALMLTFLGRIAGNLALTLGAFGGIYIAGGIAGQLGSAFDRSDFRREFEDKGRFGDYMKAIPTFLILHPFPAFVGLRANLFRS